jgi:hypothetical protein
MLIEEGNRIGSGGGHANFEALPTQHERQCVRKRLFVFNN